MAGKKDDLTPFDSRYGELYLAGLLTRIIFKKIVELLESEIRRPVDDVLSVKYYDANALWEFLENKRNASLEVSLGKKKKSDFACDVERLLD